MTSERPNTVVYVDGFNLYYAVRNSPHKWLDLAALGDRVLPANNIVLVRYFTALVKPISDPQQPQRQQAYLRALAATPRVRPHFGQFNVHTVVLPLSENTNRELHYQDKGASAGSKTPVRKYEEKGSDVNLATYLLIDAYSGSYQEFAVISNDTDLVEPIRHVSKTMGIPVTLVGAVARPAKRLVSAGDGFSPISEADFAACQLGDPTYDSRGAIHKPPKWNAPPY